MKSAAPRTQLAENALICFAVKEEVAPFKEMLPEFPGVQVLVSGMGQANAEFQIERALQQTIPSLVLTCGFAGGLNPRFQIGDVLFDEDTDLDLSDTLGRLGAFPAKFHCSKRVAVTVAEKAEMRRSTKADAVEMESSIIRAACQNKGILSATLRVISDMATEDLPLDFNALMTADQKISIPRLMGTIAKSPGTIPRLLHLQRNTKLAAERLAAILQGLLRSFRSGGA
ncbi:MAG: phosphorylase family protein [Verrucomicrobiota bacterium]